MNAAVVSVLGQPPSYQQFPEPTLEQDEVLVEVRAAGLHPIVKGLASGSHYASGSHLPAIPGVDGVGRLEDGTRAYFLFVRKPWGTMAERAAAPRATCIAVPDALDDLEAAAIANPGMSAWVTLRHRAALEAGETVLIMGATGVAGQVAIQAARLLGAKRVIAAGRNLDAIADANVDATVSLGAPEDAICEAFSAEVAAGIDVIIDYLWGRPTELLLEALAKGFNPKSTRRTRLVEVGDSAGRTIALVGATLRSVDLTLLGSGFGSNPMDLILSTIPHLFAMAAKGHLHVDVEPVPLTQVETAWSRVEKGRRIVFTA